MKKQLHLGFSPPWFFNGPKSMVCLGLTLISSVNRISIQLSFKVECVSLRQNFVRILCIEIQLCNILKELSEYFTYKVMIGIGKRS